MSATTPITDTTGSGAHEAAGVSAVPFTAVLFDLDGTITDSAPVILDALEVTLAELGLPVPVREELLHYVGPPLTEGFERFAGLTGQANSEAVALYRSHYRETMCQAPLYDGVPALIGALAATGTPVALATSKRETFAAEILAHDGLSPLFTVVAGAGEGDQGGTKAEVIASALRRLRKAGANLDRVVHVGDRAHDVEGAAAQGLDCIGVLWGYGDSDELAGARWQVRTPAELAAVLGLKG